MYIKTIAYTLGLCPDLSKYLENMISASELDTSVNYSNMENQYVPPEFKMTRRLFKERNGDFTVLGSPLYSMYTNEEQNLQLVRKILFFFLIAFEE